VAAVSVTTQLIEVPYKARSDRVEVNVEHQCQEVNILLAQDGFKAVLEKVAVPAVGLIVPQGITGQETPHDRGDRHRPVRRRR
jgi:hypothetical protein